MVAATSAISISTFQRKLLPLQPCSKQRCLHLSSRISCSPNRKLQLVRAQFRIPDEVKVRLAIAKDRVWKSTPDRIKDFPWKKAEAVILQPLLFLARESFKWCFIAWFLLGFVNDVIFAISKNQELVMPFGLFLGCLGSDSIMEASREELFPHSESEVFAGHLRRRCLAVIGCFCVVLKLIAPSFSVQGGGVRVFLLFVANGGLLQILWLWQGLLKEKPNLENEV
ncbi:hypothetical protein Dimus_004488 [Dionaea muscipula]